MSKVIEKKVLTEYFNKIIGGEKTYELRLADWECQQGDTLVLNEINPNTKQPTGRSIRRKVGYVGKTKDFDFWTKEETDKYGYQLISLLQDNQTKLYRFSPIESKDQLYEAIKYTHFACYKLCKQSFGKYLPNAGNIGIFCHYDSEYDYLTSLREELTEPSDNFNQKYFRLHEPIVIPPADDVPETTYTYLYIRRPDPYRYQVGDLDFYLEQSEYDELKQSLLNGNSDIKGARAFDRTDLDMVELYNPDVDALGYVSTHKMTEKVRVKQ